jgi:hypothetical protein
METEKTHITHIVTVALARINLFTEIFADGLELIGTRLDQTRLVSD